MSVETSNNFINQLEKFSNPKTVNSQEVVLLPPTVSSGLESGCFDFMQESPNLLIRDGRRLRFQELSLQESNKQE